MPTQPELVALATQFSVPPPVVYALSVIGEATAATVRTLSDQFAQTRSWEAALTKVFGGDPQSPGPVIGGQVHAALGIAASRPQWGMSGWRPVDMNAFAAGAKAMERTAKGLVRLGGVVTPDHASAWGMAITTVRQPQGDNQEVTWKQPPPQPTPHIPGLHDAKDVGQFGSQLKAQGITPDHFMQLFPTVAKLHRRMLGSPHVSVEDFIPHAGQTPDMVLQSVRDMPHKIYPEHTTGKMHDAYQAAQQYSIPHAKRSPTNLEVSRFVSAGMTHKDIEHYYATRFESDKPIANEGTAHHGERDLGETKQKPKVVQGGKK